jgi:MFS family permease
MLQSVVSTQLMFITHHIKAKPLEVVGDLFGRRWITTMGNLVCFVGHMLIATSKSANQLIAGMAVVGFGGGAAQTAIIGIPELLPNRMRHIGIVLSDGLIFIILLIGPVVGRYVVDHGDAWRWMFYASAIGMLVLNLSTLVSITNLIQDLPLTSEHYMSSTTHLSIHAESHSRMRQRG